MNAIISSGVLTSSVACFSNSMISESLSKPSMKLKPWPFETKNFNICKASISSGKIQLQWTDMVSLAEEKTLLQGTAEPWMGIISIARAKMVEYQSWFSYSCKCVSEFSGSKWTRQDAPAKTLCCWYPSVDLEDKLEPQLWVSVSVADQQQNWAQEHHQPKCCHCHQRHLSCVVDVVV